ncbi:hypothetical protein EMPG_14865 [Blastomyces silverae]|uniref:Fluoroacetyl-CoA-specific thioesterase-like domain-containing protein n=1 Tax=Blastomyces silverae TaxID=2060906 RepID=A0A0H1BEZ2_9EURO|nr:hypothetical protein EMPG_14865 [Blastomyces silverae]
MFDDILIKPDSEIQPISVSLFVGGRHLASAQNSPGRHKAPAVLSTSSLVDLMEAASSQALQPILSFCAISVVARMSVVHSAPRTLGATITAAAHYQGREEDHFKFEIVASDAGGEVGRSTFWRSIVCKENLENMACLRSPMARTILAEKNTHFRCNGEGDKGSGRCRMCYPFQMATWGWKSSDILHNSYSRGFHHAVHHGSRALVRLWLGCGVDLSALWETALYTAVYAGRADVLKMLMEKGANPKEWRGSQIDSPTLLHIASEGKSEAVMTVLLEAGLDPNKSTYEYSWTPLSYMMLSTRGNSFARVNIAKLLLDAGAKPDLADDMNWTSLHLAIESGDADMVKLLIERGASLALMTEKGDTPLCLAVRLLNKRMVRVLLDNGCNPSLGSGRCSALGWLEGQAVNDLHPFQARSLRP